MLLHNKVLRNIEIFDFVIFRDGSYEQLGDVSLSVTNAKEQESI